MREETQAIVRKNPSAASCMCYTGCSFPMKKMDLYIRAVLLVYNRIESCDPCMHILHFKGTHWDEAEIKIYLRHWSNYNLGLWMLPWLPDRRSQATDTSSVLYTRISWGFTIQQQLWLCLMGFESLSCQVKNYRGIYSYIACFPLPRNPPSVANVGGVSCTRTSLDIAKSVLLRNKWKNKIALQNANCCAYIPIWYTILGSTDLCWCMGTYH